MLFLALLFTHILPPMQFKSAFYKCHIVGTCENVNVFLLISYLSSFYFFLLFINSINMKEFNRIIKVNLYKQFMIIYDHLSYKRVLLVSCTTNKKKNVFFWWSKYVKNLRKFIIIDFFPTFFSAFLIKIK